MTTSQSIPPKCIPLSHTWVFYFDDKQTPVVPFKPSLSPYKNPLSSSLPAPSISACHVLGKFDTVQGFWSYWNNINLPTLPQNITQLRLLREGICVNPEESSNASGGKWVIACDKSVNISQTWLLCLLALIGEQFRGDYIVGSVLSLGVRNTISIWISDHTKKCLVEKDICSLLKISRDNIRFQRNSKESSNPASTKKTKCFSIKVSKSVDLTRNDGLNSGKSPMGSPTISPSTSTVLRIGLGEEAPFLDLTSGSNEKKVLIKSPTEKITLSSNTTVRHRSSVSTQFPSQGVVQTPPRMAQSIDSANLRKWRATEISSKISVLPPLFRRRGRRLSIPDKSRNTIPKLQTLSLPSPHIPEPQPKTKENVPEKTPEKTLKKTAEPILLNLRSEKPQVNSLGVSGKEVVREKVMIDCSLKNVKSEKPKKENSLSFLGVSSIRGLIVMAIMCVVILGSYIAIFSPKMNVNI